MKIPVIREDDAELLGYAVRDTAGWQAQTIFGYTLTRTETQEAAEDFLHSLGLNVLTGVWHYFDKDDRAWFPCVIQEAFPTKVIVLRTNEMGYQDPDDFKRVILQSPGESVLVKNS